ncbi:DUF2931 family protein [Chryseobacterium sp. SNU WT5]|uniref:DUF2931 family protein n=1 Tax=Chryseobacterium sp. SNU WT5 TaxID=2594269 RepID=UPI00117CB5F6|nr:DUF2931 family protein [Chryseobacterium sp. SNU WT5]QDP84735.1 DUF2931 family protein [Chryseobacterium sp. SNU WT5]
MEKENEMYTKLKIIFAWFLFISVQACNKQNDMNSQAQTKFGYSVTVSAPKEYPVEVHEGWLMDEHKKFICAMPKAGVANTGWLYDGKQAGQGGSKIPYHLNLTYVAYAEKKFYTVDADLPTDKILAEFNKGFDVEGDQKVEGKYPLVHDTYDTFTVGAAPGGVVVIWLSGNHNRVEICRLQAKEVFVDRNDFYDNANERTQEGFFDKMFEIQLPEAAQEEIREKGIPFGLWDNYRERFKYRFVLQPYDEKDVILTNDIRYYNGEQRFYLRPNELAKGEYELASIPYSIEPMFTKYHTDVLFDDQEMLSVFKELQSKHPNKPMDIIIIPTFMYTDFKLSVKCEDEIIPLTKYKVKGVWGG